MLDALKKIPVYPCVTPKTHTHIWWISLLLSSGRALQWSCTGALSWGHHQPGPSQVSSGHSHSSLSFPASRGVSMPWSHCLRIRTRTLVGMVVFSRHGGVGWMVGLNDLRGLFQPMILWFYALQTTNVFSKRNDIPTCFYRIIES